MCQADQSELPSKQNDEGTNVNLPEASPSMVADVKTELPAPTPPIPSLPVVQQLQLLPNIVVTPAKRGRGRPKRVITSQSPTTSSVSLAVPSATGKLDAGLHQGTVIGSDLTSYPDTAPGAVNAKGVDGTIHHVSVTSTPNCQQVFPPSLAPGFQVVTPSFSGSTQPTQVRGRGRKTQSGGEPPHRRGKMSLQVSSTLIGSLSSPGPKSDEVLQNRPVGSSVNQAIVNNETVSSTSTGQHQHPESLPCTTALPNPQSQYVAPVSSSPCISFPVQMEGQSQTTQAGLGVPRRRGRKQASVSMPVPDLLGVQNLTPSMRAQNKSLDSCEGKVTQSKPDGVQEPTNSLQEQTCHVPDSISGSNLILNAQPLDLAESKKTGDSSMMYDSAQRIAGKLIHLFFD